MIGVDDDYSRAVFAEVAPSARRSRIGAVPVALDRPIAVGHLVPRRQADRCRRLLCRLRRRADAAGRPQRPERRLCLGRLPLARLSREEIVAGPQELSRPAASPGAGRGAGQVTYVNDSKATNADATARALSSYRNIYWIIGGQAKEGGVAPLAPYFDRISHAFLIGEATELFAGQLEGKLAVRPLRRPAVGADAAHARAQAEATEPAVVLLSPACASWDQWKSYEHRGDAFREMARALPGAESVGRAA